MKENGMSARKAITLTDDEVKEFWNLFGPPPILNPEDEEVYETIRKEYVAFYRPTSRRHISFIRELVDTEWEMFGLVKIRTKLLSRNYYKQNKASACNLLERPFWDIPAMDKGVDLLDRIDKWRNTGTVRRNNLLKMIEYYCPPSDDHTSIPEAETKKIDQTEPKQIAAPSIAPTEGKANDLATQNPDEPGEREKE
jgi:hypothetical protein